MSGGLQKRVNQNPLYNILLPTFGEPGVTKHCDAREQTISTGRATLSLVGIDSECMGHAIVHAESIPADLSEGEGEKRSEGGDRGHCTSPGRVGLLGIDQARSLSKNKGRKSLVFFLIPPRIVKMSGGRR
jgi:hypothetical protein